MLPENWLVTVIIPVFNGERWISSTLASAAAQTHSMLEILVIDDGSTDGTAAIVEAAASRDDRIRLIRKQNGGVSAARNKGIAEARGELIAPLDADDLWHREKIARQVAAMRSPEVGLVYCWAVEIDENDRIIPPVYAGATATGKVLEEVVANAGIIVSGANPLIRRSCLMAVGGYDPNAQPCEDWKIQLSLAEICDFALVPAHLVGYRRTSGSASKNVARMARSMENVSRWIMDRRPDLPPFIWRQMVCHRNRYLAHLALTNDQFACAVRYKAASLRAWPLSILSRDTVIFWLRWISRMAGLTQLRKSPTTHAVDFKNLH